DRAAVLQMDGAAEDAVERRRVHRRRRLVAAAATERAEQREAVLREARLLVAAAEPARVLGRRPDDDPAGHLRSRGAAVLSAEEAELAEPRRREPEPGVAARNDVLLEPERGNEEAVDRVLRRHQQAHRLAERDVQLVDLAAAVAVLQLPHPLL